LLEGSLSVGVHVVREEVVEEAAVGNSCQRDNRESWVFRTKICRLSWLDHRILSYSGVEVRFEWKGVKGEERGGLRAGKEQSNCQWVQFDCWVRSRTVG